MVEGIAIVSQTPAISMRETARVAAAVQTQVLRDVEPAWHVSAPVNAFFRLEDAPLGHWPVVIRDDMAPTSVGVHRLEGNPVGVASTGADWSVTASRIVLDLLVNPDGGQRLVGPAPEPEHGDVEFVVSIGSAGNGFTYDIHGYPVSDFVYPAYYQGGSGPYCATGHIGRAGDVIPGGFLTWWDGSSGRWWQLRWTAADQPERVPLEIDTDDELHRQFRRHSPVPAGHHVDLRESTGSRPTGATHRAQRINDHLNRLQLAHRSFEESPNS